MGFLDELKRLTHPYEDEMEDDYDEDETAARKERIYEERKKRAFQEIYDRFSNTISVSYSSGLWDSLDLTSEFEKNDADFFEIYAEYAIK